MKDKKYIVYLHSCGLTQSDLIEIFMKGRENPQDFFINLGYERLGKYIKNKERRKNIVEHYNKIDMGKIDAKLEKLGVTIICIEEKNYPESLKNIAHPPYILYIRGKLPNQEMFGVVGARKMGNYGKKCIEKIIPDIAQVFCIVSGGAAGCDSCAHKTTLQSGGKTVVVIGTGIDITYPVNNRNLFEDIIDKNGAIVSIFRLGEPGNPYNFPVRNEVVVGFSRGVLVVEAEQKSGSLITANLCLDMGKDLFSIPGDIFYPGSKGTNMLIKNGEAKSVGGSTDILEEYDILMKKSLHKQKIPRLSGIESEIYEQISQGECDIDFLSTKLQISASEVMMKISLLELKKIIKKNLSGKYSLV